MKKSVCKITAALLLTSAFFLFTGCEKKTEAEKQAEKIEKELKKAGKEIEKGLKNAGSALEKSLKEASEETKSELEKLFN